MRGPLLRLLDANANRAREALRVVEDYARFVLNDQSYSAELKRIRHGLAEALAPCLADAILHRDTPGDVGTRNTTESEQTRTDLAHVVTAAGKRLGEALRSIEEFLKISDPLNATKIEALRYSFYDVEQRLARTLRPADRFAAVRLYVLITEKLCRRPWLQVAEQALLGGADCLQLREKELDAGELLLRCRRLIALCRAHGALCIVNDRPDVAILADADGVHVGQEDLPAMEARKIVGSEKIVGVSTHRIEQARQAVLDGADYIGVGPIFRSATKLRDILPGPAYATEIAREIKIPAVAIAGIDAGNVDEVLSTGIRAVAVSSAVIGTDDVRAATWELKDRLVVQENLSVVEQAFLPARQNSESMAKTSNLVGQAFLPAHLSTPPSESELEITRRRLPHWRLGGSVYFLTFRVAGECELDAKDRAIVLQHIQAGDGRFYLLFAVVVMPDHVHMVLRPNDGIDLGRITKGIKGPSAKLLNIARNNSGQFWQDECFDRIVRDDAELDEKLKYMLNNPVKKGMVSDPWTYDGWYYNPDAK